MVYTITALAETCFGLLVAGILLVYFTPARRSRIGDIPSIGMDPGFFGFKLRSSIEQYNAKGWKDAFARYSTHKDEPYYIYALKRTVLPTKYLQELIWQPDKVLSHREAINRRYMGEYNGMDVVLQGHVHADVTRVQLTSNIGITTLEDMILAQDLLIAYKGVLLPALKQEMHSAIEQYVNEEVLSTGTPILLVDFLNTTVARMTSRAFVGSPLCQENDWLGMAGEHPRHMFSVSTSLKTWPSYLRPFVAPHLQARKKLNEFRGRLQQKLSPLIEHRRAMKELPKAQRPVDMLQWLVDNCKGYETKDDNIVSKLLFLNLAAIGTTTATLEQILVELCQRREYIEILREEVNSVLGLEGGLNLSVLKRLTKMDSFMKETVRINPLGYFGFTRVAMQSMELSDGLKIPRGEAISLPTGLIGQDEQTFEGANEFDGLRFEKLRTGSSQVENSESVFAGLGATVMTWGVGRLTCPGRWFADAQIKLILSTLLTEYDFSFPEGQKKRAPNFVFGDVVGTKKDQRVVVRKRRGT